MEYEEGDLVLCTVDKVDSTICFVHLPNGKNGTIISSEIAPGRIKFMRQYVVPHKKVVCKILKFSSDNIELSLRRVNPKEKKKVMEEYKQELANKVALKNILGSDYNKTEEKILTSYPEWIEFLKDVKNDINILDKFIPSKYLSQVKKVIEKKKKQVELKYLIEIKCLESDGIDRIKRVLNINNPLLKITYISAGNFILRLKAEDFKEGKKVMHEILEKIEKDAKKELCDLEYKEEKQ
jgi:translation initiation factor 2 alpha subunit (eIF-2alpha)